MTKALCRPVFATRQPLLIAGVREVLITAGVTADPWIVDLPELGSLLPAENCLVILDGQPLPDRDTLAEFCRCSPASIFVLWTAHPTSDLLQAALECGIQGLLSTGLPLEEATRALLRICDGERLFRFDADPGPRQLRKPQQLSAREQQIMLALSEGGTNAGIAAALNTTESSVKVGLSRMFRKTGARNRQELMALGAAGPVSPQPQPQPAPSCSFDARWMLEGEASRRGEI